MEIKVESLKEYLNKEISASFLLQEIHTSINRYQNAWQDCVLSDATGTVQLRIWNENMKEEYKDYVGKVVKVLGRVASYQDRICIEAVSIALDTESNICDFVYSITDDIANRYFERLDYLIGVVKDNSASYGALLEAIFTDKTRSRLRYKIGGSNHHAYFGGLLVHIVETGLYALRVFKLQETLYGDCPDREMPSLAVVITAALLHDIGKLLAYEPFPSRKHSERGLLVPTEMDSALYASSYNNQLEPEKRVQNMAYLIHAITCAGFKEDVLEPRTLEAFIVHEANVLSCTTAAFTESFDGVKYNTAFSNTFHRTLIKGKE